MTDLELISEAAKVDNDAVRELIRRFNDYRFEAEILEEKYKHQRDLVAILRQTVDIMEES